MLNDSKTEIIHFHSAFRTHSVLPSINIGGSDITASLSAKDLGVLPDDTLQLKDHVRNVCRKASFGICKIGRIRKYLHRASTERLVHAFVSSHFDCNNPLLGLYGLPHNLLSSLQRVQNSAARLITSSGTKAGWPSRTEFTSKSTCSCLHPQSNLFYHTQISSLC